MTLQKLFNKYGADKSSKHKYHTVYENYFKEIREKKINFLEIGIFKGNSIEALIEYFPNATIYGIDIFKRLTPDDVPILKHERVKWIKADSRKSDIIEKINKYWPETTFDIILDDGMHTPEANKLTFRMLSDFLKDDGVYFIEDVFPLDIMTIKEMNNDWIKRNSDSLNHFEFQMFKDELKDWRIKQYDLRDKTGQPDSYIYRIKR
tara:strand:- start:226 stop:843 length:618 start_codon:yes stop_codon:yes gene_type:complete